MASNAIKTTLTESLAAAMARVRMASESDSQFLRRAIAELVADRLDLDDIPPEWLAVRAGPKARKK